MIINMNKDHPSGNGFFMIDTDFTKEQISDILGLEDRVGAMVTDKAFSKVYVRNSNGWELMASGGGGTSYTAGNGIEINDGTIKTKIDGSTIKFNSQGQMYSVGGGTSGVFMATYSSTTYAEIKTAYDAGKFIYVYVPGTSDEPEHYAGLGKFYEATGTFFFPTTTYEGYLVQYACNENTGWTNEQQQVQSKLTAGTGIRISDDNVISTTGGTDNVFKAVYSETEFADVYQAVQDGKLVYMINDGCTYTITMCTTTTITFAAVKTDKIIYYTTLTPMYVGANDNGWSDIIEKQLTYTAGTGIKIEDNVISATGTSVAGYFIADYGTTTITQLKAAYDAGQPIICYNSESNMSAPLTQFTYTSDTDFYIEFDNGGTNGTIGSLITMVYYTDDTGTAAWDMGGFNVQSQLTAGTGIDITDNVISATGGSASIFWATYDSTTRDEIYTALNAGKLCMCEYNKDIYTCNYHDTNEQAPVIFYKYDGTNVKYVKCSSSWESGTITTHDIFWAEYGTTTYEEMTEALNNNKQVMLNYGGTIYYYMNGGSYDSMYFYGPRFNPNLSVWSIYFCAIEDGTWRDFSTLNIQEKLTAGTGIKIENNTISATGGGSSEYFVATAGTTTFAEIKAAYDAGKPILCVNTSTNTMGTLIDYRVSGENHQVIFSSPQAFETTESKVSYINMDVLSNGVWSDFSNNLLNELTAGSGIDITNNVISVTSTDSKVELITHGDTTKTYDIIKGYIDAGKIVFCQVNNYESSGYNLLLRVDWWNASTILFTNTAYGGASTWSNAVQFRCNLTSSGWGNVEMIHIGAEMAESNKIKELEERIAQLEELLN